MATRPTLILVAEFVEDGKLARHVGKELQDQVSPRVGGDRRIGSKAHNPGGNAGFGIVGRNQRCSDCAARNSGVIE